MRFQDLVQAAGVFELDILGGFAEGDGTVVMLGPHEPGFWAMFQSSPEMADGAADPMDRWSRRVIDGLAEAWGGQAFYPFGGPPYHPFQSWALRTGRAWASPIGFLVHDVQGLMVSYRGAVLVPGVLEVPAGGVCPCEGCARPCLTACPVDAFADGYDLARCHDYLDRGAACMTQGCAARRACPVSQSFPREPDQSAFHMRSFHP